MCQENNQKLFELLASAISGKALGEEEDAKISSEKAQELLKTARFHDIDHIVALGLKENRLIPEENKEIDKIIFKAVYRYQRLNFEYERVCAALEGEEIPFLPLKGAVIRKYYREPWLRTSCDVDILVREEDAEKAKELLLEKFSCTYEKTGSHDISLFTPSKVHIELHYDLVEDGIANEASVVLKDIWDRVTVKEGFEYWCEMPDEIYYFYHIAHMAKHFEGGGCGVRPFVDLWILDNLKDISTEKRNQLLEAGGLLKFAESARKLSRVWFENEDCDSVSKQMENYIMRGGVYGDDQNRIMVQQQKKGGRIRYALSRIFISYSEIKFHYPILQKHRWLTPFMHVRRWCKLIFCGHLGRVTNELHYSNNISSTEAATIQQFLKNIGL